MPTLILRRLGLTNFTDTWHAMQKFTAERGDESADELWLTTHPAVYTLGLNRKNVRLPSRADIPVVLTDRGGKITYHGTGQIVVYVLVDLKRRKLNIRKLVSLLENTIVQLLADFGIQSAARADAPGVYVDDKKIAALGLRIKNECCYHGLSLNVNMDLTPFKAIDPCGYVGLEVTQTKDLGLSASEQEIGELLVNALIANLGIEQKHD